MAKFGVYQMEGEEKKIIRVLEAPNIDIARVRILELLHVECIAGQQQDCRWCTHLKDVLAGKRKWAMICEFGRAGPCDDYNPIVGCPPEYGVQAADQQAGGGAGSGG